MNKQGFIKLLVNKGIKPTHHNTNNDWGFGGAIKDVYDITDTISIHTGIACFRHTGTTPFINLRMNGNIIAEDMKEIKETLIKLSQWEKLVNK